MAEKCCGKGSAMNYKIVTDSSSNVFSMEGASYATTPMKIIAEKEYVDAEGVDVTAMVEDLRAYKGKSGSSCPNVGEWLEAFGDAEVVFGITISRNLSGSYNAACHAARTYMEEHPGRRAYILDSMATGPAMAMYTEKILALIRQGVEASAVWEKLKEYQNHVHLLFCLESINNLARNGRTSPAIAKIAGVLGIRMCGEAQDGKIALIAKPRGARKAVETMARLIRERGLHAGSMVRIAHCLNLEGALELRDRLLELVPGIKCIIEPCTALCSFYAEAGGLIVGFEGTFNTVNNNLSRD